jgi:hypothetical protein
MLPGIVDNLVTAAISAAAGYALAFLVKWWRLKHLRHLASDHRKVRIVFPALQTPSFPSGHMAHAALIPKNIPLMPMAEGKGIANIVAALRDSMRGVEIEYVAPSTFVDDGVPFVCVGGPSVNPLSAEILSSRAPAFALKYPEHVAMYDQAKFAPQIADRILQEDFGFLLQTRSRYGTNCIVVCGVWATGTEIACLAYADRVPKTSPGRIRGHLRAGRNILVILRAPVAGYQVGGLELVSVKVLQPARLRMLS